MKERIWCFATPTRAKAIAHPKGYYDWMRCGEELYTALRETHPVTTVWPPRRKRYAFETFPHAITWHLRGGNATARRKRVQRRALLEQHGFDVALLTNIDIVDAALCALTAHMAVQDASLCVYGEGTTGFIIVPGKAGGG
jgi:hypothetical protein